MQHTKVHMTLLWNMSGVLFTKDTNKVGKAEMNSTQLAQINDILTGVYVVLTLIIAGAAIWSIRVVGKQSKVAIAVLTLIIAGAAIWSIRVVGKQSKVAIAIVREQIAVSEQQAREALFNQHKPIVIPVSPPYTTKDALEMRNAGSGIALNTWGTLTVVSTNKLYRLESTHFILPEKQQVIDLLDISYSLDFVFPTKE